MSAPWTREHDATLARLEGLDVRAGYDCYQDPLSIFPPLTPDELYYWDGGRYQLAPHYLTDLTAGVRAAEAWVAQDPDYRLWRIERHGGDLVIAELRTFIGIDWVDYHHSADTPAAALAQALHRAVATDGGRA